MPVNLSEFGQPWDGATTLWSEKKAVAPAMERSAGSGCRAAWAGRSGSAHAIAVPIPPAPAAAVGPGRSGITVIGWPVAIAVRRIVPVRVIGVGGIITAVSLRACQPAA